MPDSTDLFGQPVAEPVISEYTGKGKRSTMAKGYASRPGGGPAGETCETCNHCVMRGSGNKTFYKCGKVRHAWTGSVTTDIRLKSPACVFWEKLQEPAPPPGMRWLKEREKFPAGYVFIHNGVPGKPHAADDQLVGKRVDRRSACTYCFCVAL